MARHARHPVSGEQRVGVVVVEDALSGDGQIGPWGEQYRRGRQIFACVAQGHQQRQGETAPGRVARNRDAVGRGASGDQRAIGGQRVVEGCREGVLGGQAIVEREQAGVAPAGQA